MSVANGQKADANNFNSSFVSKEDDSTVVSKVTLNRTGSGDQVDDVQQSINDNEDNIAINRADIDSNDVELADHESRISTNETDIATLQTDTMDLSTNQTAAGEKTFSDDATFSQDVTITGDLTVDGTTTTINTETLDVEDANITINNGGNDASSEGAGLDVERTGDNGQLLYKDALDNKWEIGGVGNLQEVSGIIKDTLVNLQALVSPSSSNLYFATDTLEHFRSDGTDLQPLGSGGGGGGLDTFHTESFETTVAADWSTGNSATFLTVGGGLVGTLSDETTSPIAGASSLKYVSAAVSINDWFASPTYDLDLKQRGNDIGINFYFTLPTDATYEVVFWDVTNSAKLNSALDIVEQSGGRTRYSASVFIPDTCTQYKYGFHSIVENGAGHTLTVDDFEFSTNPFVYKNLVEMTDWESYTPTLTSFGTPTNMQAFYKRVGDALKATVFFTAGTTTATIARISLPAGLVIDSSKVPDDRKSSSGSYHVTTTTAVDIASSVNNNGVLFIDTTTSTTDIFWSNDANTNASGVVFNRDNANSFCGTGSSVSLEFEVPIEGWSSSSEHVVTPAKSGNHYYRIEQAQTSLTNTANEIEYNLGTATIVDNFVGSALIEAQDDSGNTRTKFTALKACTVHVAVYGAVSSSTLSVLKNGTTVQPGDKIGANDEVFNSVPVFLEKDDYITVGTPGGALSGNATLFTTTLMAYSRESTFLAAVPVQKVAYINTDATDFVNDDTGATTSYKTVNLNSVDGDSSFVSISSDQFTLPAGKYDYTIPIGCNNGAEWIDLLVYDITSASNYEEHTQVAYGASGVVSMAMTPVHGTIEITSARTFEFRTKSDVSSGSEFHGRIKITKLR